MRLKNYCCVLIFFLVVNGIFAQEYKIDWGERIRLKAPIAGWTLIGTDEENTYVIDSGRSILTFNSENDLISNQRFGLTYDDVKLRPNRIFKTKYKIFAASYTISRKGVFQLYTTEFENGKFGATIPKYQHDFEFNSEPFHTALHYPTDVECHFRLSQDSSKVVFANQTCINEKKKENDQMMIVVFDEKLNELWSKKVNFPYTDSKFLIQKVVVDDNGEDVFLLGAFTEKYTKGNYQYKVFHITRSSQKEFAVPIKEGHVFNTLGVISDSRNQQFTLVGAYKKRDSHTPIGLCALKMDMGSFEILNTEYQPFAREEIELIKEIGGKFPTSYVIENLFLLENGNIQGIIQNRESKHRSGDNSLYGSKYYVSPGRRSNAYGFFELIVFTLNQNNKFLNKAILNRTAFLADGQGYTFQKKDDQLYLVVGRKITRSELAKYNLKVAGINGLLTLVVFNENGKIIHNQAIIKSRDFKQAFERLEIFSLGNGLYLGGKGTNRSSTIGSKPRYLFGKLYFDGD